MSDPAVLTERDGHVLTITLNRPDKRNAFNAEVLCRLCDAWDLLDGDPELRVAIMTGADGNFSAGADLDRLVGALTSGKPAENEFEERIRQDFGLIYKGFLKDHYVQKPIIAAVEVGTGREVAIGAGEDGSPDVVVAVDQVPGIGEAAEHLGVEGVALLGAVEGDLEDVPVALDEDGRFRHAIGSSRVPPVSGTRG